MHLQETRLDTPLSFPLVDHEWRAEAEHDADEVGGCEGPGRSAGSQTLRGDFGCVGVSNG
jgi:hypothetical protein